MQKKCLFYLNRNISFVVSSIFFFQKIKLLAIYHWHVFNLYYTKQHLNTIIWLSYLFYITMHTIFGRLFGRQHQDLQVGPIGPNFMWNLSMALMTRVFVMLSKCFLTSPSARFILHSTGSEPKYRQVSVLTQSTTPPSEFSFAFKVWMDTFLKIYS